MPKMTSTQATSTQAPKRTAPATQLSAAAPGNLAHTLDLWYARLGRQYGPLSRPQRRVLRLVADYGRLRMSELAERLDVTTAGATRMVDRLEELAYLARERATAGSGDGREVYVTLTGTGAHALTEADDAFTGQVQATLAPLTSEECAQLATLLQKITAPGGDSA